MSKKALEHLCQKLRNGEYNGRDIMQAWLAIEELQSDKDNLIAVVTDFLANTSDQELEIDVWEVLTKIGKR